VLHQAVRVQVQPASCNQLMDVGPADAKAPGHFSLSHWCQVSGCDRDLLGRHGGNSSGERVIRTRKASWGDCVKLIAKTLSSGTVRARNPYLVAPIQDPESYT